MKYISAEYLVCFFYYRMRMSRPKSPGTLLARSVWIVIVIILRRKCRPSPISKRAMSAFARPNTQDVAVYILYVHIIIIHGTHDTRCTFLFMQ